MDVNLFTNLQEINKKNNEDADIQKDEDIVPDRIERVTLYLVHETNGTSCFAKNLKISLKSQSVDVKFRI